jgi:cobalt-zinc-cadmium efflux system outer membrane protein
MPTDVPRRTPSTRHHATARLVALASATLLLAACAAPGREDSERAVRELVAARMPALDPPLGRALANDAAAIEARLRELRAQPLTPRTAVEVALLRSPQVGTTLAGLGLSRADLLAAVRTSNPTIGGARAGADGAYRTTVDFALGLGDLLLLPARRRLGAAEFALAQRRVAQEMLVLAADVEIAWYTAVGARQVATMRDAVAQAAGLSAELAQRFFDAGNINPLQLAVEKAAASQFRVGALNAAFDARRERLALLRTIGVGSDPDWQLADRLPKPQLPTAAVAELVTLAAGRRADLEAARREIALLEDALGVARRWRLLGELRLGGEREKEPSGEVLEGPTLELALPIFDQGQPGIARAEARLAASRAALRELELAIDFDVRTSVDRLETAAAAIDQYERLLVPAQQAIVEQQQRFQNFMLIGQFELLLAKQQEYDVYQGYLEAVRDFWIARTDLERAVGGALPGGSPERPAGAAGEPAPDAGISPQDLPGMPAEPDIYRLPPAPQPGSDAARKEAPSKEAEEPQP